MSEMNDGKEKAAAAVVLLDPATLIDHPSSTLVPRMTVSEQQELIDAMKAGFDPAYPIKLASDGKTLLDGYARRDAAIQNGIKLVPCVLANEDADQIAEILQAALLRRHLTEDQRAVLAKQYSEHRSAAQRTLRGRKGAEARHGTSLSSETDEKQDSRKESAVKFRVAENKLKQLAELEKLEKKLKVPPQSSLKNKVIAGQIKIGQAVAGRVAELHTIAEDRRRKELSNLPAIEELHLGDPTAVLRRLRDSGPSSLLIHLAVLDVGAVDNQSLSDVLKALKQFVADDAGIFVIADWKSEATISKTLSDAGVPVTGRLIWEGAGDSFSMGRSHRSLLWCPIGKRELTPTQTQRGDVLHHQASNHNVPLGLFTQLIELATVEDEVVFIPFASGGQPVIAARNLRRRCIAVVADEPLYLDAREAVERQFDPGRRFDFEQQAQEVA